MYYAAWMFYPYLDQLVDGGERGLPVRVEGSGHVGRDGEGGRLALDAGGGEPGEESGAGQRGVLPVQARRVELGVVGLVQTVGPGREGQAPGTCSKYYCQNSLYDATL